MLSKATLPRWTRPLLLLVIVAIALGAVACGAAPSRGWSGPLLADGVLYVGTIQGKVVAYNVPSQEQVWAREVAEPQSSGGAFNCVNCSGGQSSPMSLYGTPAARGDRLYIGAYNGEVLWVARDGTAGQLTHLRHRR